MHTHTHTHTHEQYSFLKATAFERVLRVRNTVIFSQENKRMEKFATEIVNVKKQSNVRLLSKKNSQCQKAVKCQASASLYLSLFESKLT